MPKQLSTINSLILSVALSRRRSSGVISDQQSQVDDDVCKEKCTDNSTNDHDCEIDSKSYQKKNLVKFRTESSHRDASSSNIK